MALNCNSSTGSWIYLDVSKTIETIEPVALGRIAVASIRSPDKEGPNEDSAAIFTFSNDSAVIAVADGFGGCRGGDRAAAIAMLALQKNIAAALAEGREMRSGILDGFEDANRNVLDLGIGAATTLAVIEISGREIRSYHVGDSTILIVGQRGKIKLHTVSHSPVGYAVESGVLNEREAMYHDERHLVSNMVGSADMHIEIGAPLLLAQYDTVIVGSDGLFDNLHSEEIIESARKGPLQEAAHYLTDRAIKRMTSPHAGSPSKPDDLSLLLFRLY